MAAEIAAVRQRHGQAVRGRPSHRHAGRHDRSRCELIIDGGASAFVAGLGVPTEVVDLCHRHDVLVVSMCGKVEHARARRRGRLRPRGGPGHRGRRPHGPGGHVAPGPPDRRRRRATGCPSWPPAASSTAAAWRPPWRSGADGVWVGTRFIATPEARGVHGYKERLLASREDQTTVSRAYSGKTMRVVRNEYTDYYDAHPDELKGSPSSSASPTAPAPCTSGATRPPTASTSTRSATRPARASARSPSWCRRVSSCGGSSPRRGDPRPPRRFSARPGRGRLKPRCDPASCRGGHPGLGRGVRLRRALPIPLLPPAYRASRMRAAGEIFSASATASRNEISSIVFSLT